MLYLRSTKTALLGLALASLLTSACAGGLQLGAADEPSEATSSEPTLVDCSEERFQSGNTAKSLMGWSDYQLKQVNELPSSDRASSRHCEKLISHRGDAHCQEPSNAEYRGALIEAQAVCPDAAPATDTE